MFRKVIGAALVLLLLPAVHLHPAYRVRVEGMPLPGLYSAAQLRQGQEAARAAAEELLPGPASLPKPSRSLRLCFSHGSGSPALLSDALLLATEGVALEAGVSVNGIFLGTAADGSALLEQLRETIRRDMPEGAAVGNLGGQLRIRPVYTRPGHELGNWDLILRITDLAPVFYLDREGRLLSA